MGVEGWLSYNLSLMSKVLTSGDPNFEKADLDSIHVDAPSLTMQQWMVMFWIENGIWKEMTNGTLRVDLSKSKTIR